MLSRRRFLLLAAACTALPARAGMRDWFDRLTGQSTVLHTRSLPQRVAIPADAPVVTPPAARGRIALFTDYNCPDCRRLHQPFRDAVARAGDVGLAVLPTPLITPTSREVAAIALAARQQQAFVRLHDALMAAHGVLDRGKALDIATGLGLDAHRLEEEARSPAIAALLDTALAQHRALALRGVPALVLGDEAFRASDLPGADFGPLFDAARRTG